MPLERQPDALPTNKAAIAATIASVFATFAGPAVMEVWPQVAPALAAGPNVTGMMAALVSAIAGLVAAYYVPDRAGVS